ncbi:MAG: alpha/beta hydrolase [archaeon]|nr:alpha/beta hydrolase [archaeon]
MGIVNRSLSVFGMKAGDKIEKEIPVAGIRSISSLAYAADAHGGHFLDMIWTREAPSPMPIIIYFNGTGFHHTNKSRGSNICRMLAKRGYLVINTEFRDLRRGVTVKDQIEDVLTMVRWLRKNSHRAQMDFDNVYIASSGYGSLMAFWTALMFNGGRLTDALGLEDPEIRIKGLGMFTGMTDTENGDAHMRRIAESIRRIGRTDPGLEETLLAWQNHDLRRMPPVFQVTSDSDSAYPDVVKMDRLLEMNRIPHELMEFEAGVNRTNCFMEEHTTTNECTRAISRMLSFFEQNQ